jgi:transposase
MLYKHFTEKLLGLQDLIVTNIEENDTNTIIYAEMQRKTHKCIFCGHSTDRIHDYRIQKIKDIPAFGKLVTIILRKRRYRCTNCQKRFYEVNNFLGKYYRRTSRLTAYVINKLTEERSFTSVAKEVNLSVTTVIRIFDIVSYPKSQLPEVLAIDEFKGNAGGEKYLAILADPKNGVVLDILPKRTSNSLYAYFKGFSREERSKVKYFISDMWKTYSDVSSV